MIKLESSVSGVSPLSDLAATSVVSTAISFSTATDETGVDYSNEDDV